MTSKGIVVHATLLYFKIASAPLLAMNMKITKKYESARKAEAKMSIYLMSSVTT